MKNIKIISLVLCLALTTILFSACNGSSDLKDWEYIQSRGKVIVGYDAGGFPPFGYKENGNGKLTGFDIEVAKAVFEYLEVKVEFKPIEWSMKEQELKNKLIDVVWNGFVITELRLKELNFSIPYISNGSCIVVKEDSLFVNIADLKNKKIAYQNGSNIIDTINDNQYLATCEKKGVDSEVDAVIFELENDIVDAVVQGELVAADTLSKNPGKYRILSERLTSNFIGVGMRKGDNVFEFKISNALRTLKETKIVPLAEKYFGTADILLV